LVMAQDERTAKFDGMPRSAIDTGAVDLVLPPEEMPAALLRHVRCWRPGEGAAAPAAPSDGDGDGDALQQVFELLRQGYGIDFGQYKPTTVSRRIQRRLSITSVGDLPQYARRVHDDPQELDALYRDLLIGVTRFLRDPDAFAGLAEALPSAVERLEDGDELRAWVAGCATGEEAYTVAILVLEAMRRAGRACPVKVFATDVHRTSLEVAAAGRFGADALRPLPPDLVARYFEPHGDGYVAHPDLRSKIVFAPHNLLRDSPFTRLDLITCRNLLIYLQPQAQRKVLSLFHFGLKPSGLLMLGPSESTGELHDEFTALDERWKVYRKRRDVRLTTDFRLAPPELLARPRARTPAVHEHVLAEAQATLLRECAPPTLVVNARGELLHTLNGASAFLAMRDGPQPTSVVELVHRDLKFAVAHGLRRANERRERSELPAVAVRLDGGERTIDVTVLPVLRGEQLEGCALLLRDRPASAAPALDAAPEAVSRLTAERLDALEHELRQSKENLQATIEELETSNEELQATNEELVASNEELQSTNEELHSVNEELYTVNAEHQQKIGELTELTADMDNLLASTEVHTLFLDDDLRLRKFTPEIAAAFRLLPQDVGRRIDTFAHDLDYPELIDDTRRVLERGERRDREVRDAGGRTYLARILPYRAREQVEGVVLTLIDVSGRKRAELELVQREERYRTLVRAQATVVWGADAQGRFVEPQAEWEADTGQRWPAYRDEGWLEAVHPEEREAVRRAWRAAIGRGEPCEARGRLWCAREGAHRHMELRAVPVPGPGGAPREWVGTILDVEDQVRAASERWRLQQHLEGLLDNSPAFLYVKDLSGRYLIASPRSQQFVGAPHDALLGRTDLDVLPPAAGAAVRDNDRAVATSGRVQEFEEVVPGGADGPRTYLSVKFPLRDAAGQVVAVAGISTDITERKRAADEARLAVQRRDRFLAMLSHELRNPLAAIVTATYALLHPELRGPASQRAPETIQRQARHMARMLDDLLDVARLTQDKLELRRERVDLRRTVVEAADLARGAFEAAGVALAQRLPDAPVHVEGDAVRLQQIVSNLLSNAARYTPEGGRAEVTLERAGDEVLLRVADTGVGIPPDEQERVFQLFYQGDTTLDRRRGGLGVGLSLVRTLVRLHGGHVRVHSDGAGAGAEFTVVLPLALDAAQGEPPAAGAGPPRLRVVLVEDFSDTRELLTMVLRQAGYLVETAADGRAGLEALKGFRPHVAIVDIGLPVMDGYELARAARADDRLRGTFLVALTGYGTAEDRRRAIEAGFDEHLIKPLDPGAVIALLERTARRWNDLVS
ncbi:MAG: PAS domain-containing protein, partial [Planctomycetota bacterium]|nr:PAS domain-containing protein [Planctomycetota bacterium]